MNRGLVLSRVKADGPISRADLVRATGLAKATVSVVVDELVAAGLLVEAGVGATSARGGRPPVLLRYDGRSELLVGVHVGVQRTTATVATGSGEELARRVAPTERDPVAAVAAMAGPVRAALGDLHAGLAEVHALAVCLPGLVDPDRGTCLVAPDLGWRDRAVGPELAAALGLRVPVRVQNTAQAVALAENLEGAGAGVADMLLVYVGTGVEAAVVHRGVLLSGARGIAGELGHSTVPGATGRCTCGRTGCLETVASAGGISAAVLAAVAGGVSAAGELLLAPLREALRAGALPEALDGLDVVPGALGQEAKQRGAILTALLTWQGAAADRLGR